MEDAIHKSLYRAPIDTTKREVLRKLRDKLRKMTDEELVRFGKEVLRHAENPFQRQLEEARREWKRRKNYRIREQK